MISRYMNATVRSPAVKQPVSEDKSENSAYISFSPAACTIAPTAFNKSEKAISRISGPAICISSIIMPHSPTEFFISSPAAVRRSNPPDKNPPTIGTELPIMYLVALNITPSKSDVAELCTVRNTLNTVTVMPRTHFIIPFISLDMPVKEICAAVHAMGAYLWCDCVQTAGVLPVSEFPADGFAISAHKFYGPKGVGAACIKRGVRFRRQLAGGQQERGMRGGTLNTPGIAGMACALSLSLKRAAHDNEYVASLRNAFESIILSFVPDVFINGGAAQRLPSHSNISFCGCDAQNLVFALDMRGVACSAGAACSSGASKPSHVLQAMNVGEQRLKSAVRFSFGKNNTVRQVECAAEAVIAAVKAIRG